MNLFLVTKVWGISSLVPSIHFCPIKEFTVAWVGPKVATRARLKSPKDKTGLLHRISSFELASAS